MDHAEALRRAMGADVRIERVAVHRLPHHGPGKAQRA